MSCLTNPKLISTKPESILMWSVTNHCDYSSLCSLCLNRQQNQRGQLFFQFIAVQLV